MLAIVIVNYCTASLVIECIASLAAERSSSDSFQVVVIDNASPDDSAEVVNRAIGEHGWASWVELVRAHYNGGFAYGNNVGITYLKKSARSVTSFLLLNPDTIVQPSSIGMLSRWLEEHPKVGIVGGRLLDAGGQPQCSGFRFPSLLGELESGAKLGLLTHCLRNSVVPMPVCDTPIPVDWVSGACCLIRRSLVDQIGLLDEEYFMYYEEVDYCRRAKRHGWEVWHAPQAEIVHHEGAASGITELHKAKPRYWYDSRRRYFVKNHSRVYAFLAELIFIVAFITWRLRRRLQRKPAPSPKRRIRDGWRYVALAALWEV